MLELAVLGLLEEQPLHGYELKKRLGETLGFLWGVSYGSLYPALRRLERDGAIEIVVERDRAGGRPCPRPARSSGDLAAARRAGAARRAKATRRTRKAYRITERGERQFTELLLADDAPADDEKAFALQARVLRAPAPRGPARAARAAPGRARRPPRAQPPRRHRAAPAPTARPTALRPCPRPATATRGRSSSTAPRSTQRDLEWVEELIAAEQAATDDESPTPAPVAPPTRHRALRDKERPHEPHLPSRPRRGHPARPRRHRRRRQLRQQPRPGRRVLPQRRSADEVVPGLMHVVLGGYHVGDVEFVAAFDVDADKVGLDLGKAIFGRPQQHDQVRRRRRPRRARSSAARRSTASASTTATPSRRARPSRSTSPRRCATRAPTCSSATSPSDPRGAEALRAGLPRRRRRLRERHPGVHREQPRVGAEVRRRGRADRRRRHQEPGRRHDRRTASSPACSRTAASALDRTYQLNFGGNMDFKNMLERERLESKKISKTQSVTSQIDHGIEADARAHRPVRPRALARRPQVGLHPARGPQLRRRAR